MAINHIFFINEYGSIVEEGKSKYKVVLSGSYEYSFFTKGYLYEIKTISPQIPLSKLFCTEMLF
jgi:hypothetical protein